MSKILNLFKFGFETVTGNFNPMTWIKIAGALFLIALVSGTVLEIKHLKASREVAILNLSKEKTKNELLVKSIEIQKKQYNLIVMSMDKLSVEKNKSNIQWNDLSVKIQGISDVKSVKSIANINGSFNNTYRLLEQTSDFRK